MNAPNGTIHIPSQGVCEENRDSKMHVRGHGWVVRLNRYVIHSFEQQKDASTERWDETTSFGTVLAVLITEMLDHQFLFITNPDKVQKCKRQYRCEASDPIVYE